MIEEIFTKFHRFLVHFRSNSHYEKNIFPSNSRIFVNFRLIAINENKNYGYQTELPVMKLYFKEVFQNYHLNFQFALSLISCGRYTRALMILDECILIKDLPLTRCIGADISLFKLHDPIRSLKYLDEDTVKMVIKTLIV